MSKSYTAISNISLPSSLIHAQSLIMKRKENKAIKEDSATAKQRKRVVFRQVFV